MRATRIVFILIASSVLFAQNAPAPDQSVVALERGFADAEQHHDLAWIQQHIADDAIIYSGGGSRSSKQEMLQLLPDIHLSKFDMADIVTSQIAPDRVLISYDANIVTSYGDLPAQAYRFRVSGIWDTAKQTMLFHQSSYTLTAPPTGEQLIDIEKKLIKAETDRDVATMSVLLADDAVAISGTGARLNKQEVLAALRNVPAHEAQPSNFTLIPLGFDGVLISYRLRSIEMLGALEKRRLYTITSVWRRNPDGKWQLVYHQGTENPQSLAIPEK